jgi:diguanylate cyclase (GGDEF)-like protein
MIASLYIEEVYVKNSINVNVIFLVGIVNPMKIVYNMQNMNNGKKSKFQDGAIGNGEMTAEQWRSFAIYATDKVNEYVKHSTVDLYKATQRPKSENESTDETAKRDLLHAISLLGASKAILKRNENMAKKDASEHMFDDLTGLPHRVAFRKYLETFPKKDLCFMIIDGKGLKGINDVLGRGYGDDLIISIAQALQESLREFHYMCRYGGDEFLVGFVRTSNEEAEQRFKQRIRPAFHEKMSDLYVNMPKAFVDLRCGVASTTEPELQKEYGHLPYMDFIRQIINKADERQNAAKESEDEREINKMAMMRYVELDQRGQVDPEKKEEIAESLIDSTRKEYYKIKMQLKRQLKEKETSGIKNSES